MMGELVMEDEGLSKPFKPQYVNPIEVGIRIEAIIKVGLGMIMHTGVILYIIRTLGVGQEVILTIEEAMNIIHKVIKDTEIITTAIEGTVAEVRVTIEIEAGH